MSIPDARAQAYLSAFTHQYGAGGMAVFRGMQRYQYGHGIGDIFGGLLRRFLPVVLNMGRAALDSFSKSNETGASIKDALRNTMRPMGEAALSSAAHQIGKLQKGSGKRKHKGKRKAHKKKKQRRQSPIAYNF